MPEPLRGPVAGSRTLPGPLRGPVAGFGTLPGPLRGPAAGFGPLQGPGSATKARATRSPDQKFINDDDYYYHMFFIGYDCSLSATIVSYRATIVFYRVRLLFVGYDVAPRARGTKIVDRISLPIVVPNLWPSEVAWRDRSVRILGAQIWKFARIHHERKNI